MTPYEEVEELIELFSEENKVDEFKLARFTGKIIEYVFEDLQRAYEEKCQH